MNKFNKIMYHSLAGIGLATLLTVAYIVGHNYGRGETEARMHQYCSMSVPMMFQNDNREFVCIPKPQGKI